MTKDQLLKHLLALETPGDVHAHLRLEHENALPVSLPSLDHIEHQELDQLHLSIHRSAA